jgi:sugar (pentulose or hexulose) kinase
MELVLGIDLGTHGTRVLAVDAQGTLHARGVQLYKRDIQSGGIQEQPLGPVWRALCDAIRQTLTGLGPNERVIGLAATHQRGTVVALDADHHPIAPAVCDSDTRSVPYAQWLAEHIGAERLYHLTGCPPLVFNGLTKILWWRAEKPQEATKVKYWTSLQDWIVLQLTGRAVSHPGAALRMGVLDIQEPKRYADELLGALELGGYFMPLVGWNRPLGRISTAAAQETGLESGIPVFAAPGDQPAAVLGTGALARGDAVINLGTSFLISIPTDSFVPQGGRLNCTLEVLPADAYALELGSGAGANVLDWLWTTLFELAPVEELMAYATASHRGARGVRVMPLWWGALDSQLTGGISGLRSDHTRADVVRATLEGLACEVRWIWERITSAFGRAPEGVALCGGLSRNDLFCQILTDTLERPLYRVTTADASAFGAAVSAAVGLNWYTSVREAARGMSCRRHEFVSDDAGVTFFQNRYQQYLSERG